MGNYIIVKLFYQDKQLIKIHIHLKKKISSIYLYFRASNIVT
jgi:hypothetical protein